MLQMIQNIPDIIALILLFGVAIFVHELGHFLAAVRLGMVVDTFSIGFGPALWKRRIGTVTYKIGAIPFGGYVAIPQLDPTGMETLQDGPEGAGAEGPTLEDAGADAAPAATEVQRELPAVAGWKKIIVAVAGPAGNVVFGIALAWVIYLHPDAVTRSDGTRIGGVDTNSPAYAAGVRPGDEIAAVNGRAVTSWYKYNEECLLGRDADGTVSLTLRTESGERDVRLALDPDIGFQGVAGIERGSPCIFDESATGAIERAAGILPGDRIVAVEGRPVAGPDHFRLLADRMAGRPMAVRVERAGTTHERVLSEPVRCVGGYNRPIIGTVMPGGPAARGGMRTGDVIVRVDGEPIVSWEHFRRRVAASAGRTLRVDVERAGEIAALEITPEINPEHGRAMVGVELGIVSAPPWMQFKDPWAQVKSDARAIFRVLKALVTPREAKQAAGALGGPLMIIMALWASIKIGWLNAIGFLRFLNINLAILNLLPIPVLDGGHIVFATIESVTRRRTHPKLVAALVNACAILLIGVMLIITFRDVRRMFPGFLAGAPKDAPAVEQVEPTPEAGGESR